MNSLSEIKERVKSAISLADYVVASGVPLKGGPPEFKGLCPFHFEKTPSFTVNVTKGLFHCFGCGVSGDLFEFVMRTKGLDFMGALKLTRSRIGTSPLVLLYQVRAAKLNHDQSPPSRGQRSSQANPHANEEERLNEY